MTRHYCTVCRSWYRSWSLHGSSRTHMNNLRKLANPASSSGGRKAGRHALGKGRVHSSKRLRQHEDVYEVRDYYRNPPTPPVPRSVTDKVWYVGSYWRHLPVVSHVTSWAERAKARERARARRPKGDAWARR